MKSQAWEVRFLASAVEEMTALGRADQQRVARQIRKLERAPQLGESLGNHQGFDLAGCRRLRVGKIRVVYELVEEERAVDVLAVGAREGAHVYQIADKAMGGRRLRRVI